MNTQTQEALNMAIEALNRFSVDSKDELYDILEHAITLCEQALEQPAQKPVAIDFNKIHELLINVWNREISADDGFDEIKCLMTTNPKQWQGLTDDEQSNIFKNQLGHDCSCDPHYFYLAIEQALKEKNT
jgi:hypothetical protein